MSNEHRQIMNVVYNATGKDYVRYLTVAMASFFENHKAYDVRVWIMNPGDYDEAEQALFAGVAEHYGQKAKLIYFEKNIFKNYVKVPRWGNESIYGFLCTAFLLPDTIERVLCLGVDTIVTRDLSELYNMDFQGHYCIGCVEHPHAWSYKEYDNNSSFVQPQKSFSTSGCFMFLNLNKIRNYGISPEKLNSVWSELPEGRQISAYISTWQQMFPKDILYIAPLKWHASIKHYVGYNTPPETIGDTAILHYALYYYPKGVNVQTYKIYKPWDYDFSEDEGTSALYYINELFESTHSRSAIFSRAVVAPIVFEQNLALANIWWKYARLSPCYESLKITAEANKKYLLDHIIPRKRSHYLGIENGYHIYKRFFSKNYELFSKNNIFLPVLDYHAGGFFWSERGNGGHWRFEYLDGYDKCSIYPERCSKRRNIDATLRLATPLKQGVTYHYELKVKCRTVGNSINLYFSKPGSNLKTILIDCELLLDDWQTLTGQFTINEKGDGLSMLCVDANAMGNTGNTYVCFERILIYQLS